MPNHHKESHVEPQIKSVSKAKSSWKKRPFPVPPVSDIGTVCNGELPQGTTIITCDEPWRTRGVLKVWWFIMVIYWQWLTMINNGMLLIAIIRIKNGMMYL